MDRMTIFIGANNNTGVIQAVICEQDYPHFQALGFVDSVDDVTPWAPKDGGGPADNTADTAASGEKSPETTDNSTENKGE